MLPFRPHGAWPLSSVASVKNSPLAMAVSMRVMSIRTTRPAPRFRWPTSEFPICPSGRADKLLARTDQRVGVLAQQLVIRRLARLRDGIAMRLGTVAPAIEDGEDDRPVLTRRHYFPAPGLRHRLCLRDLGLMRRDRRFQHFARLES